MRILNKGLLHIIFLFFLLPALGQEDAATDKTWEKESKSLRYHKEKDYKGPEQWYGSDPSDLQDGQYIPGNVIRRNSGRGIRYSPQQIQKDRRKRYNGYNRGGGGTVRRDPTVRRPQSPPSDASDRSITFRDRSSGTSAPVFSSGFWNVLLYIVLLALLMVILYYIIKSRKPPAEKVVVDVENDWNPEVITKTELELKLEAAMANEDYRECVRIYFTFILKELIRKGWIKWKKEKTNHHYVMEMSGRPNIMVFMECVRIYDLVWYGDYAIDREIFELLKPTLESYYKSLDPVDEQ